MPNRFRNSVNKPAHQLVVSILFATACVWLCAVPTHSLADMAQELESAVIDENHAQVIRLLEAGADPNLRSQRTTLQSEMGHTSTDTPVFLNVIAQGNKDVIDAFLANDVDVNIASSGGVAPLSIAAQVDNLSLTQRLLKLGAEVNARTDDDVTALHIAAQNDRLEIARVLLGAGADVDPQRQYGQTPLGLACRFGFVEMSDLLLAHGANPNNQAEKGTTPLHQAARSGKVPLARSLLAKGAKINSVDVDNRTPLILAVFESHAAFVSFLIESGADVTIAAGGGVTPLHLAVSKNEAEMVRLLVPGSNLGAKDPRGDTPADVARKLGFSNLLPLLAL